MSLTEGSAPVWGSPPTLQNRNDESASINSDPSVNMAALYKQQERNEATLLNKNNYLVNNPFNFSVLTILHLYIYFIIDPSI